MPKLVKFEIVFDHATFTAGRKVSGSVSIVLKSRMNAVSLQFEIKGVAKTDWRELNELGSETHYTGKEAFFERMITIWKDANKQEIGPGVHSYPFEVHLPIDCPSTFEEEYGKIYYFCRATIEKKKSSDDHKVISCFDVKGHYDLNSEPMLGRPVAVNTIKAIGVVALGLVSDEGDVSVIVKLAKTGFISGETIHIRLNIHNDSVRTMKKIEIALSQKITFYGNDKDKSYSTKKRQDVATVSEDINLSAKNHHVYNGSLIIPQNSVHSLLVDDVISVSYRLNIKLQPTGMVHTVDLTVPITMGTVQIKEIESNSTPK